GFWSQRRPLGPDPQYCPQCAMGREHLAQQRHERATGHRRLIRHELRGHPDPQERADGVRHGQGQQSRLPAQYR
ncbi:hypothetical protein LTR53_020622, partial [Teratosphaeriaceae sp. CCFEE 6253]